MSTGSRFPEHFDGKRFFNPNAPQARGLRDVLRWGLNRQREASPRFINDVETSSPPFRIDGGELLVTLINHSTVLLQKRGLHILTDPIWSERAGPLSWTGPRRRRSPGVRREDLPPIDVVLLSHDHYDHLDLPTLRWLAGRGKPAFIVPKGVARLLKAQRIEPVHELDWGEAEMMGGVKIHSVPALHFAGRGVFGRNTTLWCGYFLQWENRTVYFAGDTAFGEHFAQIRQAFGAPQLALIPIGAYEPRWFMSPIHMGPEEAVKAHEILGPRSSIAIHHGTFQLADDGIDTARDRLAAMGRKDFVVLANGESKCIF